ncbi:MAG: hypothetical protein L6Q78_08300 [Bacteroidia bacterium]|nr:hypothetical protein [Bacteroidia bacterium]
MKIVLKYIWTLMIVPPLMFLKGDLSFHTMLDVHGIQPTELIEKKMESAIGGKEVYELIVPVKVKSNEPSFTGEGLMINLYDENYRFIQRSQVIKGQILFRLVGDNAKPKSFILVSPETLDEIKVQKNEATKPILELNFDKAS